MSENATREAIATTLTPENARIVFMTASGAFLDPFCREDERQTHRENLLQILQNNDCRDMLAACMNEYIVIEAFTFAAAVNDVELLQAFHVSGMNVDTKSKYGETALMRASYNSQKDVVQLLLGHHADVGLKNKKGQTALDLARTEEIKELLCNHANTSYVLK